MRAISKSNELILKQGQDVLTEGSNNEIENLEKLINASLLEIENLQKELKALESDLNLFLDQYYGSGAVFFKKSSCDNSADNDNDLMKARKEIYNRIARVCSQDLFGMSFSEGHEEFLKIESYLADGTEQSKAPQDLLASLTFEYQTLIAQMQDLKQRKQSLLESPAYELKQEVMWTSVRTAETISRIKEDLTSHVNRPN